MCHLGMGESLFLNTSLLMRRNITYASSTHIHVTLNICTSESHSNSNIIIWISWKMLKINGYFSEKLPWKQDISLFQSTRELLSISLRTGKGLSPPAIFSFWNFLQLVPFKTPKSWSIASPQEVGSFSLCFTFSHMRLRKACVLSQEASVRLVVGICSCISLTA